MATILVLKSFKRTKFEQISKSFFDLPLEAKNRVRRELSRNVFRGYYGYGFLENSQKMSISKNETIKEANSETIKRPGVESTNGNPDIKETFAWGQGLLRGSISTWYHGPNLIPDDLIDIQDTFDSYCSEMKQIGLSLLQAFEDAFDIPGCLVSKFSQALE